MKAVAATVCALALVGPAYGVNWGAAITSMDSYYKAGEEQQELEYRRRMQELGIERMRQYNELQRQRIASEKALAAEQEKRNAEKKEIAANVVQDAIDKVPKLKFWQMEDQGKWERAKEVDAILRKMPENDRLSLVERFQKVVKFVEVEDAAKP